MTQGSRSKWRWGAGLVAVPLLVGLVGATSGNRTSTPALVGDWDKGVLHTQLYRGASVPDEVVVLALPGNCESHIDLTMKWDEEENTVEVKLRGKNALARSPSVRRTEGVDFFDNPWWPETKDFDDGRYLLWLIHVVDSITFYYDVATLDLLGSEYDFEVAPVPSIPVSIPAFVAVPTARFNAKRNGDVDFTHVFAYDGLVRGDLPDYTHFVASFIPQNLCQAHPFDYTVTSSRPYAGPTLPASEALPFSEYLRNGLVFDITVEPPESPIFPPISTNVVTYSQALTVAGGIPRGWTNDLEAIFANLAPPIRPFEAGAQCVDWFKPKRDRAYNACAPAGGGQ